jgi:Malectin domain/Bacterial Ig-like domain
MDSSTTPRGGRRLITLAVLAGAALALTGGAGAATDAFSRTHVVPSVWATSPADGAVDAGVWPGTITASFTSALSPASLTTATVQLRKPNGVQVGAYPSFDATTNTLRISPSAPLDASKTYTVTLTPGITGIDGVPLPYAFSWSFTTTDTPPAFRVDAGGPAYTTSDGRAFISDSYFRNGAALSTSNWIWGTNDPFLFQTQRVGNYYGSPIYTMPVSNGLYTVKLYFAEIQKTGPYQRIFNVDVSGTTANPDIANLDIYREAGGANVALVKEIDNVTACGSAIRVTTTAVRDYPAIAAIELIPNDVNPCG